MWCCAVVTASPTTTRSALRLCEQELHKAGIRPNIMTDCSHANSNKDPALQPLVMDNVANQILEGNNSIVGLMVESHLGWGNQAIPKNLCDLKYGVSITDACIDWDTTEKAVLSMHDKLRTCCPKGSAARKKNAGLPAFLWLWRGLARARSIAFDVAFHI